MTSSVPPPSPPPLSADELEKVAALRSAVGTQPVGDAAAWLDDACLCRYLRARGWDVAKAEAMLREALAWRARSGVANLRWQDVAAESGTGKIQRLAHRDKAGRPILVLRPGASRWRESTRNRFFHSSTFPRAALLSLLRAASGVLHLRTPATCVTSTPACG